MAPQLSVVVPFYGVQDYIDDCLASIAAQTLTDFEGILVDDGSPDGSRAIAERWAASDPRFVVVAQPNAGLGAARNTGTRHATGEYLMFVDSDDLLAPRAFEQLVTTLDASGSDFAGGNVWRLSPRWGLFVSPAHVDEFGERRTGVTIADVPLLMRDRMIWNKAYRRSFWDAHGYAFPEIRFEDYPVTLRAHLEASAVDLLPDPLYVWREREAGTSISQQGHDIANVRDRVTALHLVLDVVERLASDEVRTLVSSYLVQVDLREAMTSLLSVPDADADELERLLASVADRIEPGRVGLAPEFNQTFYRAARAHDWALCRALARWHAGQGWAGLRRELPRVPTPRQAAVAGRLVGEVRRRRLPDPLRPRRLEVRAEELTAGPDSYRLVLAAKLRPQVAARAAVRVTAGGVELQQRHAPAPGGLRIELSVGPGQASGEPLVVEAALGPARWRGRVPLDAVPPVAGGAAGAAVQAVVRGGTLAFEHVPDPAVVDAARFDAGDLVLRLATPAVDAVACVRPYPDSALVAPVGASGEARFALAELLAGDPPDNPVDGSAARPLRARRGGAESPLYAAGELGGDARAELGGRAVALRRDDDGRLVLTHRPAKEGA